MNWVAVKNQVGAAAELLRTALYPLVGGVLLLVVVPIIMNELRTSLVSLTLVMLSVMLGGACFLIAIVRIARTILLAVQPK